MDKDSICNYRKALLEETLKHNNILCVKDYVKFLKETNCCNDELMIQNEPPPPSKHYLIFDKLISFENNGYLNNCSLNQQLIFGIQPHLWGPFYWNIFHAAVAKKIKKEHQEEDLLKFIHVLPSIIPCYMCSHNYILQTMEHVSLIEKNRTNLIQLYDDIHSKVSMKLRINKGGGGN